MLTCASCGGEVSSVTRTCKKPGCGKTKSAVRRVTFVCTHDVTHQFATNHGGSCPQCGHPLKRSECISDPALA